MTSALSAPHLHNEEAAYAYVEARLWPNGPVCPRCKGTERVGKLQGKSTRIGVYKCYTCRKPFTVKVGTIFEDSKIPLHVWLQAILLMAESKKGISTHQLRRTLGVTIKTAWFLSQRIREGNLRGRLHVLLFEVRKKCFKIRHGAVIGDSRLSRKRLRIKAVEMFET